MGLPWIKFKGVSSADYDVVVRLLPRLSSPEERISEVVVPGRDGHFTLVDGGNEGLDVRVECTMLDYTKRDAIFAWLRGAGDLISSEWQTRRYKARVASKIEPERVVPGVKEFLVTFRCQPYLYEASPDVEELTSTGTIENLGTAASLPLIKVYGEGSVTIGGTTIDVVATVGEDHVVIDCEAQECYYGASSRNSKVSGGFPTIPVGTSAVTIGTGVTKVEITGNWRWY
jgi:phage-related protein